jgi:peptidoglycan/LPS O-acetylase OafA/YrhL
MNVRARRFPLFDALRGIAAVLVVARHAADHTPAADPSSTAYPYMTAMGGIALAMFFVISGFLLYRPFLATHVAAQPRARFGDYALGRILRIFPAYWLALTVITIWFSKDFVFSGDWWQFYLLVYDYFGHALDGIGPAWSLCIEVAYYAFLPFFVLFIARLGGDSEEVRLRRAAVATLALTALGLAARVYFANRAVDTHGSAETIPITFLDWLGFGMCLAVFSVWLERRGERLPRGLGFLDRLPGIAWAAAIVFFLANSLLLGDERPVFGTPELWQVHVLGGLTALAIVLPGAIGDQERGLVRRLLAHKVLLYLGLVSYGIFLWHVAVLDQLAKWDFARAADAVHPYVMWPLAGLLGAAVIATASYYGLERPAMGLRRRFVGSRADRPRGEALAEPAPAAPLPVRDASTR